MRISSTRGDETSDRFATAATARRPITAHEKQLWAELGQLLLVAGLAESSRWEAKDIVFHGGTSLHMGWASPRFSEDLDFLLNKDLLGEISKTMVQVVKRMEYHLLRLDADLRVELRDKSTSRMGRFNVAISKVGVMGKSMVKSEFWGVDLDYLDAYRATPRTPIVPDSVISEGMNVRLRAQIPIATLDSVFCDKLVAVAGRPYTKWRDIFDLWWIAQERSFNRPSDEDLARRIRYYATAYRVDPNLDHHDETDENTGAEADLSQRLRDYADRIDNVETLQGAQEELKRFLVDISGSTKLWDLYWPEGVVQMINHAASTARHVADLLDGQAQSERPPLSGVQQQRARLRG